MINNLLFFIAGFISALVLIGVLIIVGAIWWFFSYGRHLQLKRQQELQENQQKRTVPLLGNNIPL
jgi:cytoskeletal protein RodZ